jgi:hypothetical protein
VLDLLSEVLALVRAGARVYRETAGDAPAELAERLREYGDESDRHVALLEQAIRELGGDPAYESEGASLARDVSESVLARTDGTPRRLPYRLEALLLYELRDAIIGEVLEGISAASDDPAIHDALHRAAITVLSGESLGAHDITRPSERIAWLENSLRQVVLGGFGLQEPSRARRLLRGY